MDPLSIATTSATLVSTCTKLWGYINKIQNVDTAVQVLQLEITSLSQVLGSIGSSFNDPTLAKAALETQTGHEAQHWQHVKRSMEDCKGTLASLERILEGVTRVSGGLFRRPKTQIKLDMKAVEIALFQQRLTAYRQTMQLSLQMITVTSGLSQHTNISFMLEDLTVKVNSLQQSIDNSKQSRLAASTNADESRITTNLEDCVRSARKMVSSAASIVSARSVRDSQMGSEHGEQLTEQQRTRIQEWIPPPTIPEDVEEGDRPANPEVEGNEQIVHSYSSTLPSNVPSTSSPEPSSELMSGPQRGTSITTLSDRMADLSIVDPHYDLQLELIQIWRKLASTNFEAKNYVEAEKYLKRIMDRSESALGTRFDWRSEIVGMLAVVYCHLSKWEDAETMLGEIFEQKQEVMSRLARAYCRLGDWEKAAPIIDDGDFIERDKVLKELLIEFGQQGEWNSVKEISKRRFEDRDNTLETLALISCRQDDPASAEKLLEEHFDGKERAMRLLGIYYFQIRELEQAENIFLDLCRNIEEPSVTTLRAMHTLAEVKLALEKLNEAEEWALKAMRGRKSLFGKQHGVFFQSINLLAAIYEAKDELVEAEGYRGLLPPEFTTDCIGLERLWRMGREKAADLISKTFVDPRFYQYSPWHEISENIRKSANGVAGSGHGFALIHLFSVSGREFLVELLVDKGVDINARTSLGSTPLTLAAGNQNDNIAVARVLLDNGADINLSDINLSDDSRGETALSKAARRHDYALVNFLVANGASWPDNELWPLLSAVEADNIEWARVLLEGPRYLNDRNFDGGTLLNIAIRKGLVDHVQLLLEKGASANGCGWKLPLITAVSLKNEEIVQLLLRAGADIKLKNYRGHTALYYAKRNGASKICDLLNESALASPRWYQRRRT